MLTYSPNSNFNLYLPIPNLATEVCSYNLGHIKDIALKVSGKSSKSSTPTSGYRRGGGRAYPDFETISEEVPYQPGSSSSTPAWDFTRNHRTPRADPRFVGGYGGGGGDDEKRESVYSQTGDMVLPDEEGPKEWIAQVEPGVQITFVSLPTGGNDLKRIRFSRDMFDKWQAQRWWGENFDRIMELYNVQKFNQQAMDTPGRSELGRDSNYSRLGSPRESKEWTQRNYRPSSSSQYNYGGPSSYASGFPKGEMSSMDPSRMTTDSRDDASVSMSIAGDGESEWIAEDEPGVYITIRQLADGTRELRRVRFSREKFGEVNAKQWWEQNRDRIQDQYL
ncbi:hypothetical protein KY290_033252 [Solanum tuberosum]|uniref:BRX domain-containing protein n=1 Tax=Solanum tuberosum TaxID=4113 RepID=A0ABQ7U1N8_SOLTU|nr:hypothetical protein KY285_032509 [Solanum tuberosum]KAH0740209.1 hypothetical protein KY290_033252 [Solanum tuberosum]